MVEGESRPSNLRGDPFFMRQTPTKPRPLPGWLIAVGSVVLILHLGALGTLALAAPSGPWPTPFGMSMATPPYFAQQINNVAMQGYLQPTKMTHNYHFLTNRPGGPEVRFEAELLDESGKTIERVQFPEKDAFCWIRHRESLLARALGDDMPVQAPPGEMVAAPGQETRTVTIWDMPSPGQPLELKTVPEHLIPRNRPVERPSEWSLLLARSYARYLCRTHGAASVKIYRYNRDPVMPVVLYPEVQLDRILSPATFEDRAAFFGEFKP
jgi:hypothetical protein